MMAPCNKLHKYAKLPAVMSHFCGQMVENDFTLARVINIFAKY